MSYHYSSSISLFLLWPNYSFDYDEHYIYLISPIIKSNWQFLKNASLSILIFSSSWLLIHSWPLFLFRFLKDWMQFVSISVNCHILYCFPYEPYKNFDSLNMDCLWSIIHAGISLHFGISYYIIIIIIIIEYICRKQYACPIYWLVHFFNSLYFANEIITASATLKCVL